jgi:TolA-binding protein
VQFPGSIYLDNATYFAGRSHYELGRSGVAPADEFAAAVVRFEEVIALFPLSNYVDNAYYYELRAWLRLNECPAALDTLDRMQQAVPGSPYLQRAVDAAAAAGC